jgi:hypothetical protein
MVIGKAEGGPRNRHRGADQWLYVVSGLGVAKSGTKRLPHEIRNNGRTLLKTLNFYVPPAYTKSGDELPRAKP